MMTKRKLFALACAFLFALSLLPMLGAFAEVSAELYKKKDVTATYDEAAAVKIVLSGDTYQADSSSITQQDNTLSITSEGVYVLSGEWNGQIAVECTKEEDVQLVLDGVTVLSPTGPALYVKSADKVILTLKEGATNTFTDAAALVEGENTISSALYAKDDLSINGTGALLVNGTVSNGIVCKNDLIIADGNITVNAVNDAIRGKDSVTVLGGTISVTAGGDALSSTSTDEGKGTVTLAGGTVSCVTGGGADNGTKTQGNDLFGRGFGGFPSASQTETSTVSQKGMKAASTLTILGGTLNLDCADDTLHAVNINISGGEMTLLSGDDGAHADDTLAISGGFITISKSYEGLEGANILISGGEMHVTASDDGVNAAGGNDNSASGNGFGRMDMFATENVQVNISGGILYVNAQGDGLDSNGNLYISGGETYVSGPTSDGDGALDYNGECQITGGVLVAVGSSGMMQNVSSSSGQAALLTYLTQSEQAGTQVTLKDASGNTLVTYTPENAFSCVLISAPSMQVSGTYSVVCGDSEVFSAQLTQAVSTSGSGGMAFGGGRGGKGGQGGQGRPDGQMPPDTTSGATKRP